MNTPHSPDPDETRALYDQAASELLQIARRDGHFAAWEEAELVWPAGASPSVAELEKRARLISAICFGTPPRRDRRLAEAHARYARTLPAYHRANRIFLQVRRRFLSRRAGDARAFLQFYQSLYLEALGRENPLPLDAGEEALVRFRVARAPLAHGQALAEQLQQNLDDDPRWDDVYTYEIEARKNAAPLREILRSICEAVVDFLAAGELLAIRYNTFSNFIWFGVSVWKVVADLELLLARLEGHVRQRRIHRLGRYLPLARDMLLRFVQAHQEDPAQIRPKEYWYGQQYSYLTRDMIDMARLLVERANALWKHARGIDRALVRPLELPPLLRGEVQGRFLEYPHLGPAVRFSAWERRRRLLRWVRLCRRASRRKEQLHRARLEEDALLEAAWQNMLEWGRGTLELFGIEVSVRIDERFAAVAADLELGRGGHKIVFFPTHQSLLDHPVMYTVLHSPALLKAMGWEKPHPCSLLSRARLLAPGSVRLGPWSFSLIGLDPERADRLAEEVDGYVILEHSRETGTPTRRFARLLDERPGVVYGAGTTAAFALQCLPMQHALFAHLPPDIAIIPIAFRGIHALWPKCPAGNLHLAPGRVEVFVSPPMLGETTLLPRRRALRTQLEPATLFQAVHIATLLNPEPSAGAP